MNKKLESKGIKSDYIQGIRVTTPEILQEAQKIFIQQNTTLVDALEENGTSARGISPAVFTAEPMEHKYGLGKTCCIVFLIFYLAKSNY